MRLTLCRGWKFANLWKTIDFWGGGAIIEELAMPMNRGRADVLCYPKFVSFERRWLRMQQLRRKMDPVVGCMVCANRATEIVL